MIVTTLEKGRVPLWRVAMSGMTVALAVVVGLGAGPALASTPIGGPGATNIVQFGRRTSILLRDSTTTAVAEPGLGGNMPGAVVAVDGPVTRAFGLVPSGAELLAFLDFGDLTGSEQARLRASVTRRAPTAQVAEAAPPADDPEFAAAEAVALAGGLVVVLLVGVTGAGVVRGQRDSRRLFVQAGARRRHRWRLAGGLLLVPAVTSVVAGLSALALAWVTGVRDGTGFGSASSYPPASGSSLACWSSPLTPALPRTVT